MPITPAAIDYLVENRLQNSHEWHLAHKKEYETLVRGPLLELSAALGDTLLSIDPALVVTPTKTISRVRRDTRFTKDKSLYRENMWVVFHRGKGLALPTWFFEFTPSSYSWGVGYWQTPIPVRDKVAAWVLENNHHYRAAQKALDALPHIEMNGERFKRTRYPHANELQSQWVERKAHSFSRTGKDPAVLFSHTLAEEIRKDFIALAPVYHLLAEVHAQVEDQIPARRW